MCRLVSVQGVCAASLDPFSRRPNVCLHTASKEPFFWPASGCEARGGVLDTRLVKGGMKAAQQSSLSGDITEVGMKLNARWLIGLSLLTACGDDDPKSDTEVADVDVTEVDTTDTDTADVPDTHTIDERDEDVEVVTTDFDVEHVWTSDGLKVYARFDADIAPETSSGLWFTSPGAETRGGTITVSGKLVTITLDTPLDPTRTWTLVIDWLRAADGRYTTLEAPVMNTVLLNMVWHQHQPSYLDPAAGELQGPWVRKHAQKSYFDMTAILARYPKIHLNVNLTSSLLTQLERYVLALAPHVDVTARIVNESAFLAASAGKTDPWVDLLLRDTPTPAAMTELEKDRYWRGVWSMKSIAEPLRSFFPDYEALLAKDGATYTHVELAELKVWYELAWMDPDFLRGPVVVYQDNGADVVVDLSDVVDEFEGGYVLSETYTTGTESERLAKLESLANRLVADEYVIMKGVFEVHRTLGWTGTTGQVEVLTTPFFHPILPLLFDTDLAKRGQPADPMPAPSFAYPDDASLQVKLAVDYYTATFGRAPRGMWPSEGSVAEAIVPAFSNNGIEWIATDRQVLDRGLPGSTHLLPYKVDADKVVGTDGNTDDEVMIVFRDTEISDKVGFFYQANPPAENVADFVTAVLGKAGRYGEAPRVLSVILDGENAWEWYTQDHDAKQFINGIYTALETAYDEGSIVTVTGSELIDGNASRGVPAHPVTGLTEYEDLFPGSWIGGRLDTWIGEPEENLAWVYLKTARDQLEAARTQLEPLLGTPWTSLTPPVGAANLAWWRAWNNILSAEGSDWFWWYGADQTAAGGDDSPFDDIFRAQLVSGYLALNEALTLSGFDPVEVPAFSPILQPEPVIMTGPFQTLPTLDGRLVPDESEWVPPGGLFFDGDSSGAQADPNDDIARVFYGYNRLEGGRIFIGIDGREDLSAKLGTNYQLVLYTSQGTLVDGALVQDPTAPTQEGVAIAFQSGGPARRIELDFQSGAVIASVQKATQAGAWEDVTASVVVGGPVEGGTLIELQFLLSAFGMKNGDPLELAVVAVEGGDAIDVAPNVGAQIMFADPTRLVTVIFELDATGSVIPLNQYITLTNPPPPLGTGTPSIVGNQTFFGNWSPNTVWMKDDGVAPDTAAGDGIWTLSFPVVPGTGLQYKYTVGKTGDSWGGTEEYPLTNRGYTAPVDGTKRVRIRDLFADRPDPSGTQSAKTTVTIEE